MKISQQTKVLNLLDTTLTAGVQSREVSGQASKKILVVNRLTARRALDLNDLVHLTDRSSEHAVR